MIPSKTFLKRLFNFNENKIPKIIKNWYTSKNLITKLDKTKCHSTTKNLLKEAKLLYNAYKIMSVKILV